MWKKFSKLMIALAITVPMSVTVVAAQSGQDADIWSYSQDLQMRIQSGRATGQLSSGDYNSLNNLWNQIEMIRRQYSNKRISDPVRNTMMASLTNLDRQLTDKLHDYDLSHYQNWDPNKRSWRQNWWTGNTGGGGGFNDEIDSYQRNLKQRLDRGRQTGQLSGSEYNRLMASYNYINSTQLQYRAAGFSSWERNAMMSQLTQLDREITKQMNDEDQSRYRYWNSSNKSWNQNWWKPGFNFNGGNVANIGGNSGIGGGGNFNEEIDAYQNDLRQRLDRGRSSGQLSPAEFNRLMATFTNIDQAQREYRRGGFDSSERNRLMSSLTQLDRDITTELRDNNNSRYQHWDSNRNTWNQSWWKNNLGNSNSGNPGSPWQSGNNTNNNNGWQNNNNNNGWQNNNNGQSAAFNNEVNEEQKRVRELMIKGQRNGRLTAQEAAEINRQFEEVDRLQTEYRGRGYSRAERDSVMQKLKELDNSLTTKMRNDNTNFNAAQQRSDDRREANDDRKGPEWNQRRGNYPPTTQTNPTPPVVTTPPATTPSTPPVNNRGGWGEGRDRGDRNERGNRNTGVVPPTTTAPATPTTPPATTGTPQGQGDQDNERGGRRRRNRDNNQ